jgi:glycosyltransferase involved in cell wall biosynthesis
MATAAVVAFRLGLPDGVSVVAASWARALADLGFDVHTVAGAGAADAIIPWLSLDPSSPPREDELVAELRDADLVVVENVLTMPVNLPASRAVAAVLEGRAAVLHHHDPPWQLPCAGATTELPADDPAWRHVVINCLTRADFEARGIPAITIYNGFDTQTRPGDRLGTRERLGVASDDVLLLHPVRAIERKNVPAALALAGAIRATYWLPGPAEEGYGPVLDELLATTSVPVLRDPLPPTDLADAYAACDAVLFPSRWEGFGNPPIEAAIHRKPVVVGHYPVAAELRGLGFQWLEPDQPDELAAAIDRPDPVALGANHAIAGRHFSYDAMRARLAALLADAGWLP